MKVLFVTRDKKPGMIGTKIARELARQNIEIAVVAEGLSLAEWKNAGFSEALVSEGPLKMDEPWGVVPAPILQKVQPDVVVVGLSSPIRAEAWFAAATRGTGTLYQGIPLVALDDNWGSVYRCETAADLVLTCDRLGERLVRAHSLYKNHRDDQVVIIGDLSATAATEPIPQATIDAFNKAKGSADYVLVLASPKTPDGDDVVDVALASCAYSIREGAKLVVIPRWYPGAKPEDRERWTTKVSMFADTHPDTIQILNDSFNTDHLAALADGTFAATGSALRAAAFSGKIPICVWTPRLGEKLKAESGMKHHPFVSVGHCGLNLSSPGDVVELIGTAGDLIRSNQQKSLQPIPFDAAKAAAAIRQLAETKK